MKTLEIILGSLSIFCVILSILYQKIDFVKDYGNTMGGGMVIGSIWLLAAGFSGVAIGLNLKWFWGLIFFIAIYLTSFIIRKFVEVLLLRNPEK